MGARCWLAGVAAVVFAGCAAPQKAPPPANSTGWTQDEVVDSYVFGYPLVVMTTARAEAVAAAGTDSAAALNTLRPMPMTETGNDPLPPLADVDTLSANAWLDLSQEPVIVSVPNTRGRFLDARVLDMWTNVVWSTGSGANARTGAPKPQTIALVPPGWDGQLPAGIERVDAPSKNLWLGVRIAALDARELPGARRLLSEVRVAPLSVFTADEHHATRGKHAKHGKHESAAARNAAADPQESVAEASTGLAANAAAVTKLDANAFFGKLADAMRDNPPTADDSHALKELADIGVKPGESVHFADKSASAIAAGVADGVKRVEAPPVNAVSGNGWSWAGDGTGNYRDDYALRAFAAFAHAGAASAQDEAFPTVSVDSDGQPLDGNNEYVMHFTHKTLPPARAYWTITAYTPDGALVPGHVPHRSIDSHDRMRRNRDGSIDILVSSKSPGRAHVANWLPAPQGPFQLVMRLYAPQPSATDGSWAPPPLKRR
ncbi:hypothetical protein C0Z18_31615 [Trinickia dabaoshanensis]|uniref:DUF1254 domain-containing protein n=1 Tax=Trinickia dabaoshanensis TaxID=564714 RepID=A0A2N7VBC2_9BURK|nr:DUF1214 domain-containing protein [Trinickia dabaoshanensis]PMS14445.1 hypothetical protein C0Z18_31615 [Trinickia dabaoshanensis]